MTRKELLHKKKEVEGFELLEAITTACDFVRQKKPGKSFGDVDAQAFLARTVMLMLLDEDIAEKSSELVQNRKERVMPSVDLLDKIEELRRENRL